MYKNILVAIDIGHGDLGKQLIDKAMPLRDTGGRIRLVYVVEDIPAYVLAELPAGTIEARRREGLDHLTAIGRAAGIEAEAEVRGGHASSAIIEAAEECGADLIMLASHRPDFRDFFIGSTAARVVRHAQCSVLVAR